MLKTWSDPYHCKRWFLLLLAASPSIQICNPCTHQLSVKFMCRYPGFNLSVELTHREDPATFELPPPPSACTTPPPPLSPPPPAYPPPSCRRSLLAEDGSADAASVLSASVVPVNISAAPTVGPDTLATWYLGVDVTGTPQELPYNATESEVRAISKCHDCLSPAPLAATLCAETSYLSRCSREKTTLRLTSTQGQVKPGMSIY